jgi:hypothetical protein
MRLKQETFWHFFVLVTKYYSGAEVTEDEMSFGGEIRRKWTTWKTP